MLKWRFGANNPALRTPAAGRLPGEIEVRASAGCPLFGPYLDLPAGHGLARVVLKEPGKGRVAMDVSAETGGRILASQEVDLAELMAPVLELPIKIAEPLSACEVRLHCLTEVSANVVGVEIDLSPSASMQPLDSNRPVGWESRKTYKDKIDSGFLQKYLSGAAILEIGFKGYIEGVVPIVPQAIGIDLGYPGYDGVSLPFSDESVDAIYSSHCFEHIDDYKTVLRDWYRLLKVGGYIIIAVPHQYLFERRWRMPSTSNLDHKRYYTPDSLLREIAEAFPPNTYRVRSLVDNDKNFDYTFSGKEPGPPCFEIEVVIEKIQRPFWNLDDGSVRPFAAAEFSTDLKRRDPWMIETDFAQTDKCIISGPAIPLQFANYEVEYHFEAVGLGDEPLKSEIRLEVVQWHHEGYVTKAALSLVGEPGAELLRRGRAAIRFSNWTGPSTMFLFQTSTFGKPFDGVLRFKGVILSYAR